MEKEVQPALYDGCETCGVNKDQIIGSLTTILENVDQYARRDGERSTPLAAVRDHDGVIKG